METLRPFQERALKALSAPIHLICVAPTGAGKSRIYERAAIVKGRRTLLVSPLVALARQQAERLSSLGLAVSLGSKPPTYAVSGVWIMSPERLFPSPGNRILGAVSTWRPDFLVVDECHCYWEWGTDFRPAFRSISGLVKELQIKRSLWLTATLPPRAREAIRGVIPENRVEQGDFELPPKLRIYQFRVSLARRFEFASDWLGRLKGPGIVFVSTRKGVERVGNWFQQRGRKVQIYHAGMSSEERRLAEEAAKECELIVSTTAFGMGMDLQRFQWVMLWQAPYSLLALAQMIGRVGRSGAEGVAVIFWDTHDFQQIEWSTMGKPERQESLLQLWTFFTSERCRRRGLEFGLRSLETLGSSIEEIGCGACDFCEKGYNATQCVGGLL